MSFVDRASVVASPENLMQGHAGDIEQRVPDLELVAVPLRTRADMIANSARHFGKQSGDKKVVICPYEVHGSLIMCR